MPLLFDLCVRLACEGHLQCLRLTCLAVCAAQHLLDTARPAPGTGVLCACLMHALTLFFNPHTCTGAPSTLGSDPALVSQPFAARTLCLSVHE